MRNTVLMTLVLALVLSGGQFAEGYWTTPATFEPANSVGSDFGVTFAPDGLSFYVQTNRDTGGMHADIYQSVRSDTSSPWSVPAPIAEWNTIEHDGASWVSPDNLEAYLYRHPGGDFLVACDLYRSTRASATDAWGAPALIDELTTDKGEYDLRPTGDGLHAVLTSARYGTQGSADIWWTSRSDVSEPWGMPVNLSELNTGYYEGNAAVSADGLRIFFASSRPGGLGGMDLYVAERDSLESAFAAPTLMSAFNSEWDEQEPSLSPDGQTVYFRSNRPGGLGDQDIWCSTWIPEPSSLFGLLACALLAGGARRRA